MIIITSIIVIINDGWEDYHRVIEVVIADHLNYAQHFVPSKHVPVFELCSNLVICMLL